MLLERIALNLVQNAVRYNVLEGGWVEVTTEIEHGQAVLTVTNTGPVVPAYEIDNLFGALPAVAHRAHGQRQGSGPRPVHRPVRGPGARRAYPGPAP